MHKHHSLPWVPSAWLVGLWFVCTITGNAWFGLAPRLRGLQNPNLLRTGIMYLWLYLRSILTNSKTWIEGYASLNLNQGRCVLMGLMALLFIWWCWKPQSLDLWDIHSWRPYYGIPQSMKTLMLSPNPNLMWSFTQCVFHSASHAWSIHFVSVIMVPSMVLESISHNPSPWSHNFDPFIWSLLCHYCLVHRSC